MASWKFFRSMWVKKFNLQITFMYIHFSHANPPKYIVDTADIRKNLGVVYIYFFGQWFVEIKLKKLSILTCEFVSSFVARYWYKMVATPCSRYGPWLLKQSSRSLQTLTISSWLTPKNVMGGIFLADLAFIGSSKFGHVGFFVNYVSQHIV